MTQTLKRQLSTFDGCGIIIASMVGSGIFTAAAYSAAGIHNAYILLGIWVVGGIYSLCGALCYAELGTRFPQAGGEYIYLREAYGKPVAFLSGWISFTAAFSGAIALFSVSFIEYISVFFTDWNPKALIWECQFLGLTWTFTWGRLAAMAVVILSTLVHSFKLKTGILYQNVLTTLKVLAMVIFIIICLSASRADWTPHQSLPDELPTFGFIAAALASVLFSFSGWNAAGYIAEEMKDPRRSIVRSLILGTIIVTVLYLLFVLTYTLAIPLSEFSADNRIAYRTMDKLLGGNWGNITAGVFGFLLLATVGANIVTGPRVYFSMARDGLFPKVLCGGVNQWGVPQRAIFFQGVVALILLLTGGFQAILYWVTFLMNVFATLAVLSIIVMRRENRGEAAFKVPLYPLPIVIFYLISLFFNYYICYTYWETSGMGVALIFVGYLVYLGKIYFEKRARLRQNRGTL